jgi:tRNA-dihydrouridine synthase
LISKKELIKVILKQTNLTLKYLGKERGVKELRKFLGWYLKDSKYKELRKQAVLVSSLKDIKDILKQLQKI